MRTLIVRYEVLLTPDNPERDGIMYFNDTGHEFYITESGEYHVPSSPGSPILIEENLLVDGIPDVSRLDHLLELGCFVEVQRNSEVYSGICKGKKRLSYYTSSVSTSPPCYYQIDVDDFYYESKNTGEHIKKPRSFLVFNFESNDNYLVTIKLPQDYGSKI